MTLAEVSGIVVNFRTPALTQAATRSLLADGVAEVIVVENGSGDASAEELLGVFREDPLVRVEVLAENVGFGGGVNAGAQRSRREYLFVVNSDAEVLPGSTPPLLDALEDPTIGIAAPRVVDNAGSTQPDTWGAFPSLSTMVLGTNRRPPDVNRPDWVSGTAFMMRSRDFRAVGGFDERFFMYYEDVDLCRRLRAIGLHAWRVQGATVVHLHQGSKESTAVFDKQYANALDRYLRGAAWPGPARLAVRISRRLRVVSRVGGRM